MELKKGKISITTDEMCRIRNMGREQMEMILTEAMELGYRQGYTISEAETDEELRLAEADRAEEIRQALKENDRRWQRSVRNAAARVRGLGRKQLNMLEEYLKTELEREGLCRK